MIVHVHVNVGCTVRLLGVCTHNNNGAIKLFLIFHLGRASLISFIINRDTDIYISQQRTNLLYPYTFNYIGEATCICVCTLLQIDQYLFTVHACTAFIRTILHYCIFFFLLFLSFFFII